jgi:anti-sigma factor (TIGR02949 family)
VTLDCAQAQTVIECYADGELDAVTTTRFEKHLEHCGGCQRALDRLSSLSSLIKEAVPYSAAPERLSRQIRARVDQRNVAPGRAHGAWWHWLRPAALVAVTAVVTWIIAAQLNDPPAKELVAEEVISSHARATLTGHLADVASSERHTVKPWLSSKLDFSPPVPDLASAGFPLVGGRLDYLDHRPVAVLVYGRRQHMIDLFVWPDNGARPVAASEPLSKQGYHVLHWTSAGMTLWAISDLNAPELKTFAEKFSGVK